MFVAGKPYELERKYYQQIKFISPNLYELRNIAKTLKIVSDGDMKIENIQDTNDIRKIMQEITTLCDKLQEHVDNIIVTAGSLGVFIQRHHDEPERAFFTQQFNYISSKGDTKACRFYKAQPMKNIVNASGAGDAFCAGFISGMLRNKIEPVCVSIGFQAAEMALMSENTMPDKFFAADHPCFNKPVDFQLMKQI